MRDKKLFAIGFGITLFLLLSIYVINGFMNNQREQAVLDKMDDILEEYQEMQTISLMSGIFGEQMVCLGLQSRLIQMDKTLWNAGTRIDKYRTITEEFMRDPFYIEQKRKFNRNEVMYFSLLKEMKQRCKVNQTTILFFYKKAESCPTCDSQSFVLTDINNALSDEVSIFSFDTDLGLPSIEILLSYYNVTEYPCMVIEGQTYCGLFNKNQLLKVLCKKQNLTVCKS